MNIKKLLKGIEKLNYNKKLDNIKIRDIKIDSRQVEEGDLFVAIKGVSIDGSQYIDQAFSNGAKIVVGEVERSDDNYIKVENARKFYSLACKNFFYKTCDKMKIIGVTGTNGKTTITNIIYQILQKTHKKVGIIGTFGAKWGGCDDFFDTGMTTPDPYMLHKLFYQMYKGGCRYVVMEVSAHAIKLNKIDGVNFEVGVLTNITQDHLDFFKTMTNYALTKIDFIEKYVKGDKIVCCDDKYCRGYLENSNLNLTSYGFEECKVIAKKMKFDLDGSSFEFVYQNESYQVNTKLVGRYNILNVLASIATCLSLGIEIKQIIKNLEEVLPVDGRCNVIKNGENRIIIDYAHTPDGLKNILKTIKELSENKLIAVFGCGGDRDRTKRAIMGKIATEIADVVILTSDNPRSEDPQKIIEEIDLGSKKKTIKIPDRKEAIEFALTKFNQCFNIVIAGKGAEHYQEIKGKKYHFSDSEIVHNFIKNGKKQQIFQ